MTWWDELEWVQFEIMLNIGSNPLDRREMFKKEPKKVFIRKMINNIQYLGENEDLFTEKEQAEELKLQAEKEWEEWIQIYPEFKSFNFDVKIVKEKQGGFRWSDTPVREGYRVYANDDYFSLTDYLKCISPHSEFRNEVKPSKCELLFKGDIPIQQIEKYYKRRKKQRELRESIKKKRESKD